MPSSRSVGSTSSSMSRANSEYSLCTAVGAPDGGGGRLGEADETHLAGRDQLAHRPHRLLDGYVGVDAVLVVEVDVIDTEPLQAGVAGAVHMLGGAVDGHAPVRRALETELRGDHDLGAMPGNGLPDKPLVGERPVHVGGVEEVDAKLQGTMDRGDRLALIAVRGGAVEVGHAHAAEPDRGHLEVAEPASLHGCASWCCFCSIPAP